MKALLITAAAITGLYAAAADAKISTQAELRGYEACVAAAQPEFTGLVINRFYYLSEAADRNTYYLNGSAWQDGERVDVRISCDSSTNGRELLGHTTNLGRYAIEREATGIQIASQ